MTIRYRCPRCDAEIEAPDDDAGKKTTCPECMEEHTVPVKEEPPPQEAVGTEEFQLEEQPEKPKSAPIPPPGTVQESVSVRCEKCGYVQEDVIFKPGMKCSKCGSDAVVPMVDREAIEGEEVGWFLGKSFWKLPKLARYGIVCGVIFIAALLAWLLTSVFYGEGEVGDLVRICPQCDRIYMVDIDDTGKKCKKCGVRLQKAYVCTDCKAVFAVSKAKRDENGRLLCPKCGSKEIAGADKRILKRLGIKP